VKEAIANIGLRTCRLIRRATKQQFCVSTIRIGAASAIFSGTVEAS